MPILFIFMLCAYLGGNVYIFIRGLQAIQHLPSVVKWIFSILYWLGALTFAIILLFRNTKISIAGLHIMSNIGTGWLVFTLYMVIALLFFDILRIFNHPVPHSFLISFILTACILGYGYYNYKRPLKQVINIDINKSLTGTGDTLRVVGISDVHLGFGTNKKQLQEYVKMVNAEKPDLIIISGDLIDNSINPVRRQNMHEELSQLRAPLGIYMIPGNHEYISGIDDCIAFITQKTPIHFLRDSVATLPNGIQIVGRDDKSNSSRKELSELMLRTNPLYPVIVLDHQPYELSASVESGVDLLFNGHTHNGQVWPLNLLTKKIFDVSYGYAKRKNTHIYVSSGLSLWGPPFRIGTVSELIVFNFITNNN